MFQGEPVERMIVVEEAHRFVLPDGTLALVELRHPQNEPAAFSEKNDSPPTFTSHHAPSLSTDSNRESSHAHSVFMVIELPSDFGARIRGRRAALLMSQRELAEKAEVGIATIERVENKRSTPLLQTAHKIADALGCTLAQLVGEEGAEHGNDRSEGDEG